MTTYREAKCDQCETKAGMTALIYLLCFVFGFMGYWLAKGIHSLLGIIF